MESDKQAVNYQFLLRLTSLPVVHSALDHASVAYSRVKQTSPLLAYTLSTVEKSVVYANEKALPIIQSLQTPLTSADGLACRGLDKLEQTVPIIKEPTDKILQDTKILYSNALQSGVARYNNARAYGLEKMSVVKKYGTDKSTELLETEYGKFLSNRIDDALSFTEVYVDKYLPASDGDDFKTTDNERPRIERMSYLYNVVQRRTRKFATAKLQELQETAQTSVNNLHINERLSQLKALPGNFYANAMLVWRELNEVPEDGTETKINSRAWYIAQQTTQTLVAKYNTSLESIQASKANIYSSIEKLVQQAREQSRLIYAPVFQYLVESYEATTRRASVIENGQ